MKLENIFGLTQEEIEKTINRAITAIYPPQSAKYTLKIAYNTNNLKLATKIKITIELE